ncbi:hypothetical protein [Methylomonas sp. 11b]|uniref:hypothetical protein n=1 Tax=Methylomonas sp. 11b TaxID=1168169 RepID=UPI000479CFA5|nr:hypothetical protein [Methylomonas sp. 11b]
MSEWQKIRDDKLVKAWQRGRVQLAITQNKVLLIGDEVTLMVGPRRCKLIGKPRHLQQALLSLAAEIPPGTLASLTPKPRSLT